MIQSGDNLADPLPIGQVRIKSYLHKRKIYLSWTMKWHFFWSWIRVVLHHSIVRANCFIWNLPLRKICRLFGWKAPHLVEELLKVNYRAKSMTFFIRITLTRKYQQQPKLSHLSIRSQRYFHLACIWNYSLPENSNHQQHFFPSSLIFMQKFTSNLLERNLSTCVCFVLRHLSCC